MECKNFSVYYAKFGRQLRRDRVIRKKNLSSMLKPQQLTNFETVCEGGPCFVDLPYKAPTEDQPKWEGQFERLVFVRGLPDRILFSDRLDSGLCRLGPSQNLDTTESQQVRGLLCFGDKDFRVWRELKMQPGRDRLSGTEVFLASHHFYWNYHHPSRCSCCELFSIPPEVLSAVSVQLPPDQGLVRLTR